MNCRGGERLTDVEVALAPSTTEERPIVVALAAAFAVEFA